MDLEKPLNRERVMSELVAMRKAIASVERVQDTQIEFVAYQANRYLQVATLMICTGMILVELLMPSNFTRSLLGLKGDWAGTQTAILLLAGFLLLCVGINYMVIVKAAAKSGESFFSFCRRNFTYLIGLSHAFDLLIKFIVISMIIWAGRPEWIAPLLFFFTGDYLMTGRFFTLGTKARQTLALMSLALGGLQFSLSSGFLLWPLIWFSLLTVVSLTSLKRLEKVDE